MREKTKNQLNVTKSTFTFEMFEKNSYL